MATVKVPRMTEGMLRRMQWAPFGQALEAGVASKTEPVAELVPFQYTHTRKALGRESARQIAKELEAIQRTAEQKVAVQMKADGLVIAPTEAAAAAAAAAATEAEVTSTRYQVPSRRGDRYTSGDRGDEDFTLRVSNLPESVTDQELKELFNRFSHSRVFQPRDKATRLSKGFAYVHFRRREDAELALREIPTMAVAAHVLHAEWSTSSSAAGKKPASSMPSAPRRVG